MVTHYDIETGELIDERTAQAMRQTTAAVPRPTPRLMTLDEAIALERRLAGPHQPPAPLPSAIVD